MSPFIEYIIKLSLGLSVISIFYQLVLARYTFYNWNRWYLLGYSALAFVIPLINVDEVLEQTQMANSNVVQVVPSITTIASMATENVPVTIQQLDFSLMEVLPFLLSAGSLLLLARFGVYFISYLKMRKDAELVSVEDVRIYHSYKDIIPFSFGNAIFVNPNSHSTDDLKDIILHEFVHVKQNHTFDILFSELLCILNWYNPFAWLIRYAIRQNLEFIADRAVLENGVDIKQYQYLLLKVVGIPEFRIANQFNFSSLKQRIIMMNKIRSARIHLIRFLFVLPLIGVLLMACRNELESLTGKQTNLEDVKKTGIGGNIFYLAGFVIDGETGKPVENLPLQFDLNEKLIEKIITDRDGFYYYELNVSSYTDSVMYYGITGEGKYKDYAMGSSFEKGAVNDGDFYISFVNANWGVMKAGKAEKVYRQFPYFVKKRDFFMSNTSTDIRNAIKNYLTGKATGYIAENSLRQGFRKAYPEPKDVLTKFGNGYFDQRQELVGYEAQTQFYLDGKKVSYEAINHAFERYSIGELRFIRADPFSFSSVNSKMFYFTFPTYKKAPPVYVLENNFEQIDPDQLDMAVLDNEAYFLDGFRQVFGIGSNLKPLKSEIKRVMLFKGNLAKYYDHKLDKLWWIETRPEAEVYERPDLANN